MSSDLLERLALGQLLQKVNGVLEESSLEFLAHYQPRNYLAVVTQPFSYRFLNFGAMRDFANQNTGVDENRILS